MPLYEYECDVCHQRFERIQRVSAPPVSSCPACGGSVRRLLGAPALQFKGSGWYVTDYGKGNGKGNGSRSHPSESSGGEAKDSGNATTSESKKESKKDSSESPSAAAATASAPA